MTAVAEARVNKMWNSVKTELRETAGIASAVAGLCVLSVLIGMALAGV